VNTFKVCFHLAMVGAAVFEAVQAKSLFRKQLCGGFAGFHAASALIDIAYPDKDRELAK
jgi:hypothetical protein